MGELEKKKERKKGKHQQLKNKQGTIVKIRDYSRDN